MTLDVERLARWHWEVLRRQTQDRRGWDELPPEQRDRLYEEAATWLASMRALAADGGSEDA